MRMPPADERSPSATPSPQPPGRRLFSRITSPFASKSRTVTEFYLTVDDPHRQYSPGDQVTGAAHLRLQRPVRVTHLVVCLHGFVQVYKHPGNPPADGYRANNVGSGRGSKYGEYFGNGFASLFEDEVVLCGDGRLAEGAYQFNFNLEFPDRDLPSSISFERGTISYMITATLTRPTPISPTLHSDHKVYFVERIDVSQFDPPTARTITLEPISRRTRARSQAKKLVESDRRSRKDTHPQSSGRRGSQTSSSPSLVVTGDSVNSPAPSEASFDDSLTSSRGRNSRQESNATSPRLSDAGKASSTSHKVSLASRTITATVESLKGGCLRGDHLPIKIHVTHTKHVKSLHGVIITLYRQARVDLHPSIPIGPTEKGKEAKYEDYYPRSMTGLGGLSLSGAGSSHVFRKDLAQTVLPLIVDPATLTADVAGKVHVPEEAFPTIATVPGAMISFRYYVEVVLDIQGKLSTQDRNLGNLGGLASTMNTGQSSSAVLEGGQSAAIPFNSPVIDTASVRRDKGVVACTFEVVVGTRDSQRQKGKTKAEITVPPEEISPPHEQPLPESDAQAGAVANEMDGAYYHDQWYGANYDYEQQHYDLGPSVPHGYATSNGYYGYEEQYGYMPQPVPPGEYGASVPPPHMEDESQLTEKERMRRAEERLLPSQPPAEGGPASESSQAPSAPYIPEEDGYAHSEVHGPALPILLRPPSPHAGPYTNGTFPASIDFANHYTSQPRTPEYDSSAQSYPSPQTRSLAEPRGPTESLTEPFRSAPPPPMSSTWLPPTDDKRELQRRELELQASVPPSATDDAYCNESSSSSSSPHHRVGRPPHSSTPAPRIIPTAPILSEREELPPPDSHDSHAEAPGSHGLPRYER